LDASDEVINLVIDLFSGNWPSELELDKRVQPKVGSGLGVIYRNWEHKITPIEWYLYEQEDFKFFVKSLTGELASGFPRALKVTLNYDKMWQQREDYFKNRFNALESGEEYGGAQSFSAMFARGSLKRDEKRPLDGFWWVRNVELQDHIDRQYAVRPLTDPTKIEKFVQSNIETARLQAVQYGKWIMIMVPNLGSQHKEKPAVPTGGMIVSIGGLRRKGDKKDKEDGAGKKAGAGKQNQSTGGVDLSEGMLTVEEERAVAPAKAMTGLVIDLKTFTGFTPQIVSFQRPARN